MGQNKYCLIYCVLRFKTHNSSIVCSNSSNLVIMQIRQRKALLTLFKSNFKIQNRSENISRKSN